MNTNVIERRRRRRYSAEFKAEAQFIPVAIERPAHSDPRIRVEIRRGSTVVSVEWVCRSCERLIQAPVPPQVIDKGIPTAGLLAQVLVAKFADHQPLYRQEGIFERAGFAIARSTLAQWVGICGVRLEPIWLALKAELLARSVLHADETPVPMLKPGLGRTHRAYLWSYGTTQYEPHSIVVYDFAESRSGQHARTLLGEWAGKLVCDDYVGYKALAERNVVEDKIGMHRTYYSALERGEINLTLKTLRRIFSELGIQVWELLRDASVC